MKVDLSSATETLRRLNPELFGVRRAATTCPEPLKSEAALHDEIMDFCRSRGWVYFHGSMAERTHRTEGEPDFIILADGGRFFLVECKSATGKLSPAQRALSAHAAKLGHTVAVVRSMSEVVAFVDFRPGNQEAETP